MRNRVNIIIYFGVTFNALRMLVGAVSAVYLLDKGLTISDIGLMKTMQAAVILLLDIPLAYFADRYSRKMSVVLSVLFSSAWLIITAFATSKVGFYFAEFLNAISIALLSGALIAYLIDAEHMENPDCSIHKLIGKFQKYQFLAMGVSAFFGSAFIESGSSVIWYIAGTLCLAMFLAGWALLPRDNKKGNSDLKRSIITDLKISRGILQNSGNLMVGFASMMLIMGLFYQVLIQLWQPFSFGAHKELPDQGIFYGMLFSAILAIQSFSGWLSTKIKSADDLLSTGLISSLVTVVLLVIGFLLFPALVPLAVVLIFGANRMASTALQSMFLDKVPSELRSTFDSFLSASLRLLILVVLPIISFGIGTFGWVTLIIFYTSTILGCLIIYWNTVKKTDQPLN